MDFLKFWMSLWRSFAASFPETSVQLDRPPWSSSRCPVGSEGEASVQRWRNLGGTLRGKRSAHDPPTPPLSPAWIRERLANPRRRGIWAERGGLAAGQPRCEFLKSMAELLHPPSSPLLLLFNAWFHGGWGGGGALGFLWLINVERRSGFWIPCPRRRRWPPRKLPRAAGSRQRRTVGILFFFINKMCITVHLILQVKRGLSDDVIFG